MTGNLDPAVQRSHNVRNTLHSILLVLATGLLMAAMAYTLFGTTGVVIAFIIAVIGLSGLGRISPAMVLKLYKARPVAAGELTELQALVADLARRANLPTTPKLYYVPSKVLNAFAVGSRDNAAIAVTDAILRAMDMRQMAGILAHEMSHIANGDLRVMGMADVLNRITSFMSTLGLLGVPAVFGFGLNFPVLGLATLIFAPTLGGLLQLGLSRAREYDADLDGATLTGDPEGLASALALLEERQRGQWEGLVLPGSRMPQPSLLRSHPPTEERVNRLNALRRDAGATISVRSGASPVPQINPPRHNPRIQWHRLGIYN